MTDRKRIAWELERTAMGDGYYGDALCAAKELPEVTPSVRALLEERDQLAAALEAAREDAERYRLLRKGAVEDVAVVRGLGAMDYGMSAVVSTYSEEIDGDDLDAAIDAAKVASHEALNMGNGSYLP